MDKKFKKVALDIAYNIDKDQVKEELNSTPFAIGRLSSDDDVFVCEDRLNNLFIIYNRKEQTVGSNIVSVTRENEKRFYILLCVLHSFLENKTTVNIEEPIKLFEELISDQGGITPWYFFNEKIQKKPDVETLAIKQIGELNFNKDLVFNMKLFKTVKTTSDVNSIAEDYKIDLGREYNKFEKERLENNKLINGYVATNEDILFVKRIYNAIKNLHRAPSFFFYGPSGTGKSEKGKFFSKMLGLPYTFICCSAMTNEADFRGRPKSLGNNGTLIEFGKRIISTFFSKNIKTEDIASTKIEYTLTELILACRYGWIIEIQEPTLIVNAGTLGFLNCVLDNNRTLILPDGSQIPIHPNTVFIFTTNLDYEGCNPLNNSLLSRIDYVKKIDPPSLDEQIKRVAQVTKYDNKTEIAKVIKCIDELKIMMQDAGVTQGIADLRAAIDCINDCKNNNCSIRESARYTIEDKVCLEEGYAEEIKLKIDSILGEE